MPSWMQSLQAIWQKRPYPEPPIRVAILGVGHELRGDDAVGIAVVRQMNCANGVEADARSLLQSDAASLLLLEGAHAPENCTGSLRRFAPHLVLLVDAAWLGEPPGTVRVIPWQETSGLSATTHTLPLHMLAQYLVAEIGCEVVLLGIQPVQLELGQPMSTAVAAAAAEVAAYLPSLFMAHPHPAPAALPCA
ncbi:MAG: hydrogenase 3 maturation endopeptidase HyCI [Chloroflexota bacterium]